MPFGSRPSQPAAFRERFPCNCEPGFAKPSHCHQGWRPRPKKCNSRPKMVVMQLSATQWMNWIVSAARPQCRALFPIFPGARKNFAVRWQLGWANAFTSRSVQSPGRASQMTLRDEGGSKNYSGKGDLSPLLTATHTPTSTQLPRFTREYDVGGWIADHLFRNCRLYG